MSRPHHDLRVWQDAIGLVTQLYAATANFPETERYGLVSQIRRAAVSVPANIAEGAARGSRKEFARFLRMSRGSLAELDTHLRVAADLTFLSDEQRFLDKIERLQASLTALIKVQMRGRT
jgi:four helix bundle protein